MWAGVIFSFRARRRRRRLGSFLKHHLQWKIIIFNIPTLFSTSQINHSGWITDNYQECNMTNAWLTLWLMYSLRILLALSDWINISCHILTYSMWHGKHAVVRNWTNCFLWINLFVSRRGGKIRATERITARKDSSGRLMLISDSILTLECVVAPADEWNTFKMREL